MDGKILELYESREKNFLKKIDKLETIECEHKIAIKLLREIRAETGNEAINAFLELIDGLDSPKERVAECCICKELSSVRFVVSQNSWPKQWNCKSCGYNNAFGGLK